MKKRKKILKIPYKIINLIHPFLVTEWNIKKIVTHSCLI